MGRFATRQELATVSGGGGTLAVRKNSVAVGSRAQVNFIEGSNVALTVADDGTEIDVTITASGGGGTGNSYNPGGW
jgi:hypothetical protein